MEAGVEVAEEGVEMVSLVIYDLVCAVALGIFAEEEILV